jgi:hypothetical protein
MPGARQKKPHCQDSVKRHPSSPFPEIGDKLSPVSKGVSPGADWIPKQTGPIFPEA